MSDSLEVRAKRVDELFELNGFLIARQPNEITTREGGIKIVAVDSVGCKEIINVSPKGIIKSSYTAPSGKKAQDCVYTKRELPKGKDRVTLQQLFDVKTYLSGQTPPPKEEPEKKEEVPYPPQGSSSYLSRPASFISSLFAPPLNVVTSRLWRS